MDTDSKHSYLLIMALILVWSGGRGLKGTGYPLFTVLCGSPADEPGKHRNVRRRTQGCKHLQEPVGKDRNPL